MKFHARKWRRSVQMLATFQNCCFKRVINVDFFLNLQLDGRNSSLVVKRKVFKEHLSVLSNFTKCEKSSKQTILRFSKFYTSQMHYLRHFSIKHLHSQTKIGFKNQRWISCLWKKGEQHVAFQPRKFTKNLHFYKHKNRFK